mgnify:CR=1 FL=1
MDQNNSGEFRKNESLFKQFRHSCLGRIIIWAVIIVGILLLAYVTCPTREKMFEEVEDNIRENILPNDSINTDWMDDAVSNVGYIFTTADSLDRSNQKEVDLFYRHNRLEYYNHTFFSTMHIHSSFRPESTRCAIGAFGIVLTTVNFNDFLVHEGPLRKDYNQPAVVDYGTEEYFGENPDLGGVFQYNGE